MDPRYATAAAAAAANSANLGGSPNGNSADVQHLQNLAQIQFRSGASGNAASALGGSAKTLSDEEEARRKAAEAAADAAAKIDAIKAKDQADWQAAMTNPDNYKRTVSDDGGYNFYDPAGNPITVQQYSKATGKQIDKALEGSNNENDNTFSNEYKTLIQYGHAMAGDQDAIDKFKKDHPDWIKAYGDKTYAEVVKDFRDYYGSYMQPQQTNTLPSTDKSGRAVVNDTIGNAPVNNLGDWLGSFLGLNKRQNVTYR